ncbi:uncharacterized protein LOC125472898 isoform X2 [Pyrus x bretschneideri]|uniref:uncharacterized protein LOC125472898 isoform X2 n=1 Tax=Pyrus x bretschneideri TaxID=225117 RepID=UPI00202F64A9|nr:uncharacterized protein LOC125472898 isoform X2 [Pyrus x bretschneideri]
MNSNLSNNALANSVLGSSVCHKQSTLPVKKVALRDVQNDNRSCTPSYPENSFLGRLLADPIKVSGTKILSPEFARSPPCHQFTRISDPSDHLMHGGVVKKLDSELGKRRAQGVKEDCLNFKRHCSQKQPDLPKERNKKQELEPSCIPAYSPTHWASPIKFSPNRPPVPNFLRKSSNGLPAAHSKHLRFTPESEVPQSVLSERNRDEERTERFLHLQNLLKHFDESDQSEYLHMLRCLPSSELSRHAVELEKRSMQLSVEEAKEIQKMKALNILGK